MHQSGNCIHLYSLLGYKQDFVLLASAAEQEAASTKTQEKKKPMSFLEKWLCWRLASRSSHPQSPAERSVPCLELGWSERALTQPRAAQSLSVSNAGGRRGSLPTSTLCLLQSIRATKMGEREIICGNTASCMMLASPPVSCRARYTKQPPPTGRTPFQGGGAG